MKTFIRVVLRAAVLIAAVSAGACAAARREVGPVVAAVAADHALASQAGAEVLRRGGNAVDAAVATSFALSVVRPYSCGIGGGGFMLVHLAEDGVPGVDVALNYREVCPSGVRPDHYERLGDAEASRVGGHAVAVPGTVAGLLDALERWGTMDRDEVMAPAIRLAEAGFAVDADHARVAGGLSARFEADPALKRRFAFTWERLLGGGRLREGDVLRLPEQARALRLIARDGAAAFYEGEIARAIIDAVANDGGVLTAADLRGYEVSRVTPLRAAFAGRTLLAMPPPSSGGVATVQVLGLLERSGALSGGVDPLADAARAHMLIEAMKHAFADRAAYLADPSFADVPTAWLVGDGHLDAIAARIDPARTLSPEGYGGAAPARDDAGTSHLCVVDSWGNAVACTETINTEFGSLLPVPGFGFCLNNEMDDFTTGVAANAYGLTQADANRPRPGQRPLSSMTPTIVLDAQGRVEAVAGASGGPRIITGTIQALLRMVVAGQPATEAVGRPRLHHQWSPDVVRIEGGVGGWDAAFIAGLRGRGHGLEATGGVGAVQAIRRGPGGWEAASDPRKGGEPALLH